MKYFKLSEFENQGYKVTDKTIEYNITNLVDNVLDKAREYYGKAVYVNEGYNPSSKHMGHSTGNAADITTKNRQGNIDIYEFIKTLNYDQLSVNGDYESIHVSYYPKNRNEAQKVEDIIKPGQLLSDYLVCLESGHGKDVAGKRSPDGTLLEWEWAREIKYRVKKELENQGIAECFDVNPETTEPGLTTRANRANAAWEKHGKKGIFISIHINAAGSDGKWHTPNYWSIWTSPGTTEADRVSRFIWDEANKILTPQGITVHKGVESVGNSNEAKFTVLMKTILPACLIENLFQDSKEGVKFLLSEKGKNDIVTIIVNGIKNYLLSKK